MYIISCDMCLHLWWMYLYNMHLQLYTITDYTRSAPGVTTYIELSGFRLSQVPQDAHLPRLLTDAEVGRCRVITNDVIRQLIEWGLCEGSRKRMKGQSLK